MSLRGSAQFIGHAYYVLLFTPLFDPFYSLTTGPYLCLHKHKENYGRSYMLIQTKIQVDPKDYEFVKKVYKDLRYKSLSG